MFTDSCIYTKYENNHLIIVSVYVDDLLVCSNSEEFINQFKQEFSKIIKITDNGSVKKFLNLNIKYDQKNGELEMHQSDYIRELLKLAGFEDCNGTKAPMQLIADKEDLNKNEDNEIQSDDGEINVTWFQQTLGKLIYLSNTYRSDISYVVNQLCSKMQSPDNHSIRILKHLLKYLKFSVDAKLVYHGRSSNLIIYADANFNSKISTSGILYIMFYY